MKTFEKAVVINHIDGIAFGGIKDGYIYWNCDKHVRYPFHPETVIKEYDYTDDSQFEALILQYLTEYCPENIEIESVSGWMNPKGDFWYCRYADHDALARWLAAKYHKSLDGVECLEKYKWLRIQEGSIISPELWVKQPINEEQRKALWELHEYCVEHNLDKDGCEKLKERLLDE